MLKTLLKHKCSDSTSQRSRWVPIIIIIIHPIISCSVDFILHRFALWVLFSHAVTENLRGEWIWWWEKVKLWMCCNNWVICCRRKGTFLNNWIIKPLWTGNVLCYVHTEKERETLHKPNFTVYLLSFRNKSKDLQERSEHITNKARSLAAELLQLKQCLAEAKARNMAGKGSVGGIYILVNLYLKNSRFVLCYPSLPTAQALIHAPTSKSKRHQRKWIKNWKFVLYITGTIVFIFNCIWDV